MDGVPPDARTGLRRPPGRYGPAAGGSRRPAVVAAAVAAALLAVGWFAFVAFGPGNPGVHFMPVSYTVTDDSRVEVTFQLRKDPDRTAVCTVHALGGAFDEVGRLDVRIGPARAATTTVTAIVPTSERAQSGKVKACALQ
jgi:hypothetical protein